METFKKIQKVIAERLDIAPEAIRPESKVADLHGWDSINHIMIITDLEEEFDFKFRLEEIGEMDSLQKIIRAVEERVTH